MPNNPEAPPRLPVHPALTMLTIVAMLVNALLIITPLNIALNSSETVSAVLAAGTTAAAAVMAFICGSTLRYGRYILAALSMAAWLSIGVTMAVMRWNLGALVGSNITLGDQLLAVLMMCVYVATGIGVARAAGSLLDTASAPVIRTA